MSTQTPRYMYQKLVPKWKFLKINEPEKYGKGPLGLIKNLYGEQPTVCFFFIFGACGIVKLVSAFYEDQKTGCFTNLPYKKYYTVMRPDDERMMKLREDWFVNGAPVITKVATGFQAR